MNDPWEDLDVNCRGQLVLLEAVRRANPRAKIVYPGSRLEYGRVSTLPVDEDYATNPLSIDGVHKLAAEKYHVLYHRIYGLRTTVFRITNPYGAGQLVEMAALIIRKTGRGRIDFIPWPPLALAVETGDFVADIRHISRGLGWKPRVGLERGSI